MGRTACAQERVPRRRHPIDLRPATGVRRTAIQFTHRRNEDWRNSWRYSRVGLSPLGTGRGVQSRSVRSTTHW